MRKHLYLIVDHPDEELVGQVRTRNRRYANAKKNEERPVHFRNRDTGESHTERLVGLGYHDFEDEADYEERFVDVVEEKLTEIDAEHLEAAGLEPEEVLPA